MDCQQYFIPKGHSNFINKTKLRCIFLIIAIAVFCPASYEAKTVNHDTTRVQNQSKQLTAPQDTSSAHPSSSEGEKYKWMVNNKSSLEITAFRILNVDFANPLFDTVMPAITDFKRNRVLLLLVWAALVIFGGSRGRWAALMIIPLIAASDQLSSSLLKPMFARIRPCEVLEGVRFWSRQEGWITTSLEAVRNYKSSFSFPSSHATNITASMVFLGLVYRRVLPPLLVLALAVSYSRIYVGVHWPLDVLAGMAIGTGLAFPAYYLFNWLRKIPPRTKNSSGTKTLPEQNHLQNNKLRDNTPPGTKTSRRASTSS